VRHETSSDFFFVPILRRWVQSSKYIAVQCFTLLQFQSDWSFSLEHKYEYDTYKIVHHIGSLFSNLLLEC
jgi:hypothetical protein